MNNKTNTNSNNTIDFPTQKNINKDDAALKVIFTYVDILRKKELSDEQIKIIKNYFYAMVQYAVISRTNGGVLATEAIENYIGGIDLVENPELRNVFYSKYLELRENECENEESLNLKLS